MSNAAILERIAARQCHLPLSTATVTYIADLLRRHLKAIGSRWWSLPAGRITVLVPAVLRHDQSAADLAGGGPRAGRSPHGSSSGGLTATSGGHGRRT